MNRAGKGKSCRSRVGLLLLLLFSAEEVSLKKFSLKDRTRLTDRLSKDRETASLWWECRVLDSFVGQGSLKPQAITSAREKRAGTVDWLGRKLCWVCEKGSKTSSGYRRYFMGCSPLLKDTILKLFTEDAILFGVKLIIIFDRTSLYLLGVIIRLFQYYFIFS